MGRNSPEGQVSIAGFPKGLNRDADVVLLEEGETPIAQNIEFGLRGEARCMMGPETYDNTGFSASPTHIGVHRDPDDGEATLIAVGGTYLNYCTLPSAAFTERTANWGASSSWLEDYHHVAMAQFAGYTYVTRRPPSPTSAMDAERFDGSSWTQVQFGVFDGTASRFPAASHLAAHHDHLFAANVHDLTTHFGSRVHYSDALDGETWQADNFIDFTPDDGSSITAIKPFGEDLLVFKKNSVQLLSGRSEASFTRYVLDRGLGTRSPKTVQQLGGELFFFDWRSGVWAFNGSDFRNVSDKINHYLLDNLGSDLWEASAFVFRDKYYLSVTWADATFVADVTMTFVYDRRTESWSRQEWGSQASVTVDDEAYAAKVAVPSSGSTDGVSKHFQLKSGYEVTGSAVSAPTTIRTRWIEPWADETRGRLKRLKLFFAPTTLAAHTGQSRAGEIRVRVYFDWDDTEGTSGTRVEKWVSINSLSDVWVNQVYPNDTIIDSTQQAVISLGEHGSRAGHPFRFQSFMVEVHSESASSEANHYWQLNKIVATVQGGEPQRRAQSAL